MKLTEEIAQAWHRLDSEGDSWEFLSEGTKAGYRAKAMMLVENVPRLKEIEAEPQRLYTMAQMVDWVKQICDQFRGMTIEEIAASNRGVVDRGSADVECEHHWIEVLDDKQFASQVCVKCNAIGGQ